MEVGDTVRVVQYNSSVDIADRYIGKTGVITEDLPEEEMYGNLEYKVTFDHDGELFEEEELELVAPQGFESVEVNLPDDLLDMLEVWSEETGLTKETLIRYALVNYIVEDVDLV